ncbi:MAG: purine-nucleoside phosphorylase [Planctomycetaceae bacterium]
MNLSADQLSAAVTEVATVIRASWAERPRAAIILGTGLGSLAQHINIEAEWSYRELPHFARSTADGHRGRLLAGRLAGVPLLALDGRCHAYEGYSAQQITFPVRVLAALGASFLIASNASGGLNPALRSGDILLIDDHINLINDLSLWRDAPRRDSRRGASSHIAADTHADGVGVKQAHVLYDARLLSLTERLAAEENIPLHRGTYLAMLGPNYETRAEYRWLSTLADVVGMSTVPEVLVAREVGLPVVAFSMVTNVFRPDGAPPTTSDEVIHSAANAEPNLRRIVMRLLTADF